MSSGKELPKWSDIDRKAGWRTGSAFALFSESRAFRLENLIDDSSIKIQREYIRKENKKPIGIARTFNNLDYHILQKLCGKKVDMHMHEILKGYGRFVIDVDVTNPGAINTILDMYGTPDGFTPGEGFKHMVENEIMDVLGDNGRQILSRELVHWTTIGNIRDNVTGVILMWESLDGNGHPPFAWIDGCRPDKISYHLVLPIWTNKLTNEYAGSCSRYGMLSWFYSRLDKRIRGIVPNLDESIIDMNLANKNHSLRLPYQTVMIEENGEYIPNASKILEVDKVSDNHAYPWFSGIARGHVPVELIVDDWKCIGCDSGNCTDDCIQADYMRFKETTQYQSKQKDDNTNMDSWRNRLMMALGSDNIDECIEKLSDILVEQRMLLSRDDLIEEKQWDDWGNMVPWSIISKCYRCDKVHEHVHARIILDSNNNIKFRCQRWIDTHRGQQPKELYVTGGNANVCIERESAKLKPQWGSTTIDTFQEKWIFNRTLIGNGMYPLLTLDQETEMFMDLTLCLRYNITTGSWYVCRLSHERTSRVVERSGRGETPHFFNFKYMLQTPDGNISILLREKMTLPGVLQYFAVNNETWSVPKIGGIIAVNIDGAKKRYINTFLGWDAKFVPESQWTQADKDILGQYLGLIKNKICNGNVPEYHYMLKWFSFMFQKSNLPGVALYINGMAGVGKTLMTTPVLKIMGDYGLAVDTLSSIHGSFNGILKGKRLTVINEASIRDYNKEKLKGQITDQYININEKYIKTTNDINRCGYILVSNNDVGFGSPDMARRFCFYSTSSAPYSKSKYKDLAVKFDCDECPDGTCHRFSDVLYSYWITRNIDEFNPSNDKPKTEFELQSRNEFHQIPLFLKNLFECERFTESCNNIAIRYPTIHDIMREYDNWYSKYYDEEIIEKNNPIYLGRRNPSEFGKLISPFTSTIRKGKERIVLYTINIPAVNNVLGIEGDDIEDIDDREEIVQF